MLTRPTEESISLQDIRQQNAAKIFHTLREHPGISQRELVDLTGIDQGTISVIVNTLVDKAIVSREKESQEGRVGRPRMALRLSQKVGILVGASIQHNNISVVATYLDGTIISRDSSPTGSSMTDTLQRLHKLVRRLIKTMGHNLKDCLGLGIAAPVILDKSNKRILFASNLNWPQVGIDKLTTLFNMPVYVDNDVNAAAVAEKRFGACKEIDNYVYVGGYSGIGGAIVLDGKLYKGAKGFAGELGHIEVVNNGRRCGCGNHGCLEAYVSEKAMLERFAERGSDAINLDNIVLLAQNGHQFANFMLFEAGELLGRALSFVNKMLNPEYIVLGSGLATMSPYIKDELEHTLIQKSLKSLDFVPKVITSSLVEDSAPMGGIVLALEGFLSQTSWFTN
ncbi:MAG: ROK family transcriptional regulator [Deinococcota bacterium]